ncbi:hypothetical protein [Archaeoglobus profundus]|uniref:Uncharacterized protein n=1 Tax=Archaeoglobus profundus (strain DSM 5631 / JCM 9629 / NBRC 100127 / Av18) TaxID=572546 RepID=D2RHT1_ARCPA|nr:hypothetical protein [Archaeoglobus profundus]ADB57856.1 hypothetical protein Arcpr_0793 [Archaeoglobus profundus DSM 5631]
MKGGVAFIVGLLLVLGSFLIPNTILGSTVALVGVILTASAIFRKI